MKKFKNHIFLLFAVLASCNSISAQETQEVDALEFGKFGIGLNLEQNISNFMYYYQPFTSQLIFTFNIKDKFRVEPDIGYSRVNYHNDDDDHTNKESRLSIGIGGYGLVHRNPICFYYGMKLGYVHYLENSKYTTTNKTTGKGVRIGPVIGLDYFVSSHFSIGTEFKLMYKAELRTYDHDVDDNITSDVRYKNLNTIAGLNFRFYF